MHELHKELELIFNASILFISVRVDTKSQQFAPMRGTGFNISVDPSSYIVQMRMVKRVLPKVIVNEDPMHAFDFITTQARVLNVQYEQSRDICPPIYTVEFVVIDPDVFTKQVKAYYWDSFNKEFTTQLDKVLEEE